SAMRAIRAGSPTRMAALPTSSRLAPMYQARWVCSFSVMLSAFLGFPVEKERARGGIARLPYRLQIGFTPQDGGDDAAGKCVAGTGGVGDLHRLGGDETGFIAAQEQRPAASLRLHDDLPGTRGSSCRPCLFKAGTLASVAEDEVGAFVERRGLGRRDRPGIVLDDPGKLLLLA